MRGSMRRRGEAWELRIFLGRDPITGKPKARSRSFHGTKRQAEQELARMTTDALQGNQQTGGSGQTFGELVDQWYASWSPEWSPSTASETRRVIDTKLAGFRRVRLDKITPASLDAFYAALRERGAQDGGPLAQSSVRRIHAVVSSALEQAVRWGWIQTNPAQRAWKGKGKGKKGWASVVVPSASDVVALLDAAWASGNSSLAALLELEVHTGLRRSELLALRWPDFDEDRRTLRVRSAIVTSGSGVVEKPATKTDEERVVVLSPDAVGIVAAHRQRVADLATESGVSVRADGYLFGADAAGTKPTWPSSVSRSVRLLVERNGLRTIRLQELRRFHSSLLITGGVDVATETERLGHGAAVALRSYARSSSEAHERAAAVVATALAAHRQTAGVGLP